MKLNIIRIQNNNYTHDNLRDRLLDELNEPLNTMLNVGLDNVIIPPLRGLMFYRLRDLLAGSISVPLGEQLFRHVDSKFIFFMRPSRSI